MEGVLECPGIFRWEPLGPDWLLAVRPKICIFCPDPDMAFSAIARGPSRDNPGSFRKPPLNSHMTENVFLVICEITGDLWPSRSEDNLTSTMTQFNILTKGDHGDCDSDSIYPSSGSRLV